MLGATLLTSACGDSTKRPEDKPAAVAPAVAKSPSDIAVVAPTHAPAPAVVHQGLVRVASLQGAPRRGEQVIVVGDRITDGAALQLASGDQLALDVAQSGRVAIDGPALVRLGTDADAQVLVAFGLMTVIVPPAGDGRLIAQRLATPRGTFTFRPGTSAVVAVHQAGDTLVHVVDGKATVASASLSEIDPGARESVLDITRDAAQRFDDKGTTPLKPAEDVSMALLKAQAFVKTKVRTQRAQQVLSSQGVDEALAAIADEIAHGTQLADQQKAAIARGDGSQRASIQRELATHGQRLFRLRRAALVRWEQMQASGLRTEGKGRDAADGVLAAVRTRVSAALSR